MRHLLYLVVLFVGVVGCSKPKPTSYSINVTVIGQANGAKAILRKFDGQNFVGVDTQQISKGGVKFTGKVDEPALFAVSVEDFGSVPFFLGNDHLQIRAYTDSIEKSEVLGGEMNVMYQEYRSQLNSSIDNELRHTYQDFLQYSQNPQKHNRQQALEALNRSEGLMHKRFDFICDQIAQNHSSRLGAYILYSDVVLLDYFTMEQKRRAYGLLDEEARKSLYGKAARLELEKICVNQAGKPSFNFRLKDANGRSVALTDLLKGNRILVLSFWTTWQPTPLRDTYLTAVYNHFTSDEVLVVTISADGDATRWQNYLRQHPTPYLNLIDTVGQPNLRRLGINQIPRLMVVGGDGIIKASQIRSDRLMSFVDSLISN